MTTPWPPPGSARPSPWARPAPGQDGGWPARGQGGWPAPQQAGWPAQRQGGWPAPAPVQGGWPPPTQGGWPAPTGAPARPGGPYPGQPYGGSGWSTPPRLPTPRRRRPLRFLVGAVVVVGFLLLAGAVVSNLAAPTPEVAYQNDDYRVPPVDTSPPELPQPQTYAEAEQFLVANPFYEAAVPEPVRCDARPIDVAAASDAELEDHFDGLMECLLRVWEPPVTEAGWQIVRPSVTVYGSQVTTRCGTAEVNAFYCAADQQVYFSNRLPDAVPIVARDTWAADVVMAHEFGHALQARTAILISSAAIGQQSGSQSDEYALSRRLETQADCLSGMYVRSVRQSLGITDADLDDIRQVYVAVGDDTLTGDPDVVGNHGLAASREYWGDQGLGSADVDSCNTYTASARLVR